ncbi:MAG TPA: hypothetical protein DCS18_16185 [Alcanivorax sp.]|jgi:hypothetical protein|nr:hypothetical protein [Alcanivorax sp.]HAV68730.1 hypothetical protein [Alcanivorax sp.]|tara:strand:- start:44592 stop:45362 length:771 start_codon:yes stop_codon:yes gene_type:complete
MQYYFHETATANGLFTDGDDKAVPPLPRTLLRSSVMNMLLTELCNLVEGAGLTLDGEQLDQVFNSILVLINNGGAGRVGEVITMAKSGFSDPPANCLPMDGALLNRSSYPELWEFAQTEARLVSDSSWNGSLSNRPSFSSGNGYSTFRVPDVRGLFPRWWGGAGTWDNGRTAMTMQEDAIRNITGSIAPLTVYNSTPTTSGAFTYVQDSISQGFDLSVQDARYELDFDASNVVPTASENRTVNAAFPAFIRYRSAA